jgi:hypothetical protein
MIGFVSANEEFADTRLQHSYDVTGVLRIFRLSSKDRLKNA